MNKNKFLKQHGLTEAQFSGKEKINGSPYLSSLTSLPDGFAPTVGGSLYTSYSNKHIGAVVPPVIIPEINRNFFWKIFDKTYATIDRQFCEILTQRTHTIGGKSYNIFSAKKVNLEVYFFIANHEDQYAHGDNLKKAIEDLEFKITSKRLKNDPISADTIISVMHYRIVTGACELGCKQWMDDNNINVSEMKASELLPLLKKTNAYGYERFKRLINF